MEKTPAKELAQLCGQIAFNKKGEDILILDLTEIESAPAEYFVVCTAESEPQAQAMARSIADAARSIMNDRAKIEGVEAAQWILLDFFDVVVHIFRQEAREFYKLEKLWGDAVRFGLGASGELIELRKVL